MAEDLSWKDLEGTWDRLRWARRKKYGTIKDAAQAMGINVNTFAAYEREPGSSKHIAFDHQMAMFLGNRLKVRWEWLLLGHGEPTIGKPGSPEEKVVSAMGDVDPNKLEVIVEAILAMLRTGTRN